MSDVIGAETGDVARPGGQGAYVLDASALLCLINGEPGADRVAGVLSQAVISAVNLAEVATKLNELGADVATARALLAPLHLVVVPFDEVVAFATGALRTATRGQGLSLGDRACLALGASRGATVLSTDEAWTGVADRAGVAVEMLR
ncbi:type II toxin-antitoxin system VapC family toxin [Rubellimicrobium rubrum]|uniref:type II toxin-antitoxin system VapC family toxin n=1 Tax=Rubellimicrobium rubrum TaxID=2585369 RepID=UPI001C3F33AB|nr:type II toxin-antitoxin system VapC family toxin [Rubellimicrobium rubrum]